MGRREVGNRVWRKFVKSSAYVRATASLNGIIGQDKEEPDNLCYLSKLKTV